MPSKTKQNENPDSHSTAALTSVKTRRFLGYLTRPIRELINGGDTGYTLVKAGVILGLGAAAVTTLLPAIFIITGGGLFALFYVGIYLKDEYDRNKEEDIKRDELEKLKELDVEISRKISELEFENNKDKLQLLDYLCSHYLKRMGIDPDPKKRINDNFKKPDGSIPGQQAMVDLIANANLNDLDLESANAAKTILELNNGSSNARQKESKNFARSVAEHFEKILFSFHKGGTAMGLVVGGSILFGAITIGALVPWPIIVGSVAFALVSAAVALVYDYYVTKSYSDSMEMMNQELKTKAIRSELLNKLEKINRQKESHDSNLANVSSNLFGENLTNTEMEGSSEEIIEETESPSPDSDLRNSNANDSDAKSPLVKNNAVKSFVSPAVRRRMYSNRIAKIVYFASIGVVVGLAIAWLALVVAGVTLLPLAPLALTLAGAIVGGVYGLFYGYAFGHKLAVEAGQVEMQRIEEVSKLRKECDANLVNQYLNEEKPKIVEALIGSYLNYLNAQPLSQSQSQLPRTLPKLVKVLVLIEKATGIEYMNTDQNTFFNQLQEYLPNSRVGELRKRISGIKNDEVSESSDTHEKPSLMQFRDTLNSSDAKHAKQVILTYALPTLGALSVVFPLSFMAFGVGALLALCLVSVVVMASFAANKVFEHYSEKNMKQLDDDEAKLRLIAQIGKFNKKKPAGLSKYFQSPNNDIYQDSPFSKCPLKRRPFKAEDPHGLPFVPKSMKANG
jgi:hypothetical protein